MRSVITSNTIKCIVMNTLVISVIPLVSFFSPVLSADGTRKLSSPEIFKEIT